MTRFTGGLHLTETTRKPNALLTSFATGGTREILRYPRQSLDHMVMIILKSLHMIMFLVVLKLVNH